MNHQNPTITDLQDKSKFVLNETIVQNDPMPFFKKYMNQKTLWFYGFYISLFIFILIFIISLAAESTTGLFGAAPLFVFVIILPIHEAIHAIAYKLYGAKNVGFKIVWKHLIVYTFANKDVVSTRQMYVIASAPFLLISIFFGFLSIVGIGTEVSTFASFTGIFHAFLCGGDLAILNYLQINRKKEIYTYDDQEKGESLFFVGR